MSDSDSKRLKFPRLALWLLVVIAALSLIPILLGYVPSSISKSLVAQSRAEFLASALGVIATVIGLAIAGLLTVEQLDLERVNRNKDRRLSAKHAALMDGVRGINKMINQISRLSILTTAGSDISEAFIDGHSQAAPAWAVADLEAVTLMQKIANDLSILHLELALERVPLVEMALDCDAKEKAMLAVHADNVRLFRLQTDATGVGDSVAANRWSELFKISVAHMPAIREELATARTGLAEASIPFCIRCICESRRMRAQYRNLLGLIRREIQVDDNAASSVDEYCKAADFEDQRFFNKFKTIFVGHEVLIEELAREAGCDLK